MFAIQKTWRPKSRSSWFWTLLACCCFVSVASAQLISTGFDDGSTQGWGPRGAVSVTASTEVARSGTHSLKTTGRTANWNGPALNLLTRLPRNATYQVSGWVRLVAGQPASDLKFTLERTPAGGSTTYSQINAAVQVTDSGWVRLQGNLVLPAEENSACTLYLESSDPTSQYYLDDFTISSLGGSGCPEPFDQSGLSSDFENGANQGWTSRGSAVLTPTTSTAKTGSYSLAVTGRTASWQGPSINALCKMHKGSKYFITVSVKLAPGEAPTDLRVSLQADLAGSTSYLTVIGNRTVTDAQWVDLSTEYVFGTDATGLSLYIESASGNASFFIDDFDLIYMPPVPIQTNIPSLKEVLAPYFPVGAAILPQELTGEHAKLLLKHFDQVTAGNAMKWDATEPQDGVFNFGAADAIANFARANGLRMRGHTLLWHSQTPAWVFQDANGNPLQPGNAEHRALLLSRLERHIHTIVPRYADVMDSWDVVNEVIDENQPGGLRDSPWLRIIGPEFIDWAFEYASEVAGNAALYINDYNTTIPAKRAALQNVVQGLLNRGVPVDGVGHQMHHNVDFPSMEDIRQTLLLFGGMGLMNEVTELDVSAYTNSTDTSPVSQETLIKQGYVYRDTFNVFRELKDIISSVTLWGMADDLTWLKTFPITRDDKPLLFDERLQAKPAYWGVVDPSQLPIKPKTLNVTRVSKWIVGLFEPFWSPIAPQLLTSADSNDSKGQIRVVWKDNKLCVLVEVTDPSRKASDTVEVFVGNNRYAFKAIGLTRPSGADGLGLPTRDGYAVFAVVPASKNLVNGDTLAFDVRVTDSATGKKYSWSDTKHTQETAPANRGTITMIPEKKVARTLRGTPVIDAKEDTAWKKAEAIQTQNFVLGTTGAKAKVRTLWDDNRIYVYAEVTDPLLSKASANVWEQDSVEIFFDTNNAQTTAYQSDDSQYRVNYDNERSFGGGATASKIVSATRRTSTGYVVEASIQVAGLAELAKRPTDEAFIGFDFQVNNDGAGDGIRSSVSTWNDTVGNNYMDTSRFGAIQLIRVGK